MNNKTKAIQDRSESNLPLYLGLFYSFILMGINLTGGYGIFVDEYYYLACAKRISAGYIDQPPFSIMPLYLFNISGNSIFTLRIFPAISAGMAVFISGKLVDIFKGNTISIALTCLSVMTIPVLQVIFGFYSMNSFEIVFVLSLVLFLIKAKENDRHWLSIGLIAGIGILNKHTFSVYLLTIIIPYVLLDWKKSLKSKWFYFGSILGFLIILPNIYWQVKFNFPSLEFYKHATANKNINLPYFKIFLDQILSQNPATLPIWISGIIFFFKKRELRFISIAYILLLILLLATKSSRPDRIAAIYPILISGGVILISPIYKKLALGVILVFGFALAPISLPIIPPEILSKYVNFLGIVPEIEKGKKSSLPQWFGDRIDWKNLSDSIKRSTKEFSEEEKQNSIIVANFYGQAGSLEFYKNSIPIVSGHNNYYLWQNEIASKPNIYILIGKKRATDWKDYFEEIKEIGSYSRNFTNEINVPIFEARNPKLSKEELFGKLKEFQ